MSNEPTNPNNNDIACMRMFMCICVCASACAIDDAWSAVAFEMNKDSTIVCVCACTELWKKGATQFGTINVYVLQV